VLERREIVCLNCVESSYLHRRSETSKITGKDLGGQIVTRWRNLQAGARRTAFRWWQLTSCGMRHTRLRGQGSVRQSVQLRGLAVLPCGLVVHGLMTFLRDMLALLEQSELSALCCHVDISASDLLLCALWSLFLTARPRLAARRQAPNPATGNGGDPP
jgi:hypothetical protein